MPKEEYDISLGNINNDISSEKVFSKIQSLACLPGDTSLVQRLVKDLKAYSTNLKSNTTKYKEKYKDDGCSFNHRLGILNMFCDLLKTYQKTKNDDEVAQFIDQCTTDKFPECHLKQRLQEIKNDGLLHLKQRTQETLVEIKTMRINAADKDLAAETKKMLQDYVIDNISKLPDDHVALDDRICRVVQLYETAKNAIIDETALEDIIRQNANDATFPHKAGFWSSHSRLQENCKTLNMKVAHSELIPKRSRDIQVVLAKNAKLTTAIKDLLRENEELTAVLEANNMDSPVPR